MKLNLGCGRILFPLDRDNIPFSDHLLPLPENVYEPGWVNVDKHPGGDEQIDLFRFPWLRSSNGSPWSDNTADAIWCAHILEHMPHAVRMADAIPVSLQRDYSLLVNEYDGFFVFLYECWRILRPGGYLYVRAPFGCSYPSLSDPTHTRYLTPGSFGYLAGQDEETTAPFDYHLPLRFEQAEPIMYRFRGHWAEKLQQFTEQGITENIMTFNNVVDEFRLVLRAVKGAPA